MIMKIHGKDGHKSNTDARKGISPEGRSQGKMLQHKDLIRSGSTPVATNEDDVEGKFVLYCTLGYETDIQRP